MTGEDWLSNGMGTNGELAMLVRVSLTALSLVLITGMLWTAMAGTAHAYIDAGTGSMLLQVLLAGFFGSLLTLKVFWGRIAGSFSAILAKIRAQETRRF